ncbi:MAG: hypothetical protein A2381_20295 [Bdellovibrionales bacterium RIFOXYB1_FULL_37_110]|nr:MAG: hypothetical protein A2181_03930 [Bdellovibrionales bacterium RIFOXYA1_FULL_38_20]OFZ51077.1 MAG: hypothetical protein A2417_20080 [Bdellovibrionales bacterium RIFOXYC1_FULL_37_79]OFZ60289.1 MAG: hypothetical protein A2381_20295 [Bdellovibrionales bacterium RIFOXYB1_FULL_37_110]OFZ63284.1 MAG: hypothetical protein A2577_01610 [Bdellovibrionales bacterium RIFOXYD1_FULL_36_51]
MKKEYLLGLDVGGTKIECALIKMTNGKSEESLSVSTSKFGNQFAIILDRQRIPTNRQAGYPSVMQNISTLCKDILQKTNLNIDQVMGIGMGVPGAIHPTKQIMLNGNTGIFINQNIAFDLQQLLKTEIPIHLENDANLFALSEVLCGAGQNFANHTGKKPYHQTAIGIILGTGVGGGIVINENILRGTNGGGGEIGHTVLYYDGHPCYCGQNGCAEQYLSGPSLEAQFATRIYNDISKRPNSREIFELYSKKEPQAMASIIQYKKHLVRFLTNLTNIFDPDYFVLGGGVSTQHIIYENLSEELTSKIFIKNSHPQVLKNVLGDSSGVIGAAILPLISKD